MLLCMLPGCTFFKRAPEKQSVAAADTPVPPTPRSAVITVQVAGPKGASLPAFVKEQVARVARGELAGDGEFPLPASGSDALRVVRGLEAEPLISWLDPLTDDTSPTAPRFGTNNDFIGYIPDGWTETPWFNGSDDKGYLYVSHEYVSGREPTTVHGATGQSLQLAQWLEQAGLFRRDSAAQGWSRAELDRFLVHYKRQLGGSWLRVERGVNGRWAVVTDGGRNVRYDAGNGTLLRMNGAYGAQLAARTHGVGDHAHDIIAGTFGNCSGAVTPWGTIIASEENTQKLYGDVEPAWADGRFLPGMGMDAGGFVSPVTRAEEASLYGSHSDTAQRRGPDGYGWHAEIDPGLPPDEWLGRREAGRGHAKLGSLGRARWENMTFAVTAETVGGRAVIRPFENQPLVVYFGNDRRNGRVYKFVSRDPWRADLSRDEKRALLEHGTVYVSQLEGLGNDSGFLLKTTGHPPAPEDRAAGRWIALSLQSTDLAPNAPAFAPGTTVGAALADRHWNGLGGFAGDADVLAAVYTAANKIGVFEQNRPEDVEFSWKTGEVLIAYTNHTGRPVLDERGRIGTPQPKRGDRFGRIWAFRESDPQRPHTSGHFTYYEVWGGNDTEGVYAATNPDNLMLDADGDLWFGTDGSYGATGLTDGFYHLDRNPAHKTSKVPTWGKPFRVVSVPIDAEATGPALSAAESTLFLSVQHPGEWVASRWPGRAD